MTLITALELIVVKVEKNQTNSKRIKIYNVAQKKFCDFSFAGWGDGLPRSPASLSLT
jgi:hypothetical protein